MSRLLDTFKIRAGEERMSALLVGLMLFTAAGGAIGGNATEALFFSRFGVELLPYMYIILGVFSFVTSMAITAVMGRVQKHKLFVALPFILGFTLIAEWLIVALNIKWFFAVMWLVMNVIGSLQGLLTWGLAGEACDTRQAKRLFPLFSAGGILGTVIGGLLTQPLARWLHSENLLLVWAGTLFISFAISRGLISHAPATTSNRNAPSIIQEMQRGYKFVRQSPIMQWVSYSAILFSVCYFSLALPFSRGATTQYPNADELAGFLGLFQSTNTAAALIASLFIANRLFARFGIMPMLLIFPIIYLVGFGVLAFAAPFPVLVSARFAQMMWMAGIAGTAWQALFNVVPSSQRDQVRAFVSGVPEQAGTFIAGLILVVGEQTLQPQQLYLVGFVAALILTYIIWRASRAYSGALVEALRAGQPQMFISEEEPFGGIRTDALAVSTVVKGTTDPDSIVRRVSVEILGNLTAPEAAPALVHALEDGDSTVRVAALRGLTRSQASSALLEIAASLHDPEAEVRLQAVDSLRALAPYPRGIFSHVAPLLKDGDELVRAHAALALLRTGEYPEARETLYNMAKDVNPLVRTNALSALGECGDANAFELIVSGLHDAQTNVRRAAAHALGAVDKARALDILIRYLNDDDQSVRRAVADAIGKIGERATDGLLNALNNPSYEDGALMALEYLPAQKILLPLKVYARNAAKTALHYHGLAIGLGKKYGREIAGDGRYQLLLESLHDKGHRSGLNALRALALMDDRDAINVALENLKSHNPVQRANALETLEAIHERDLARPLLKLWETNESETALLPEGWLLNLLDDPYSWLRACAVLVSAGTTDDALREKLKTLSQNDPDEIVRNVAVNALLGDYSMDTLATLSLMERILFLRRVPLFADLPPSDLKQVASIAVEALYADGEILAHQGEAGEEMFVVVSGEVSVIVAPDEKREGREILRRKQGDYVGEMAIISREPRIATLAAAGNVRALCIGQKQFESILRERPDTSMAVMRVLCQRLKELTDASAKQNK